MHFDVIIPAHNEEGTVGDVVRAALSAPLVGRVFVVDDHSTDATASEASAAGAVVVPSRGRRDKAQALATGVAASTAEVLLFFDADILDVTPEHLFSLVHPVLAGEAMLSCGIIDYGPLRNPLFLRLPPITGLRALRREVFTAIPPEKLRGFQIEIMINEVIARGGMRSAIRVLTGLGHVTKIAKNGWRKGGPQHLKMTMQLLGCFRFVPLWTYGAYLRNLAILPPSAEFDSTLSSSLQEKSNLFAET